MYSFFKNKNRICKIKNASATFNDKKNYLVYVLKNVFFGMIVFHKVNVYFVKKSNFY